MIRFSAFCICLFTVCVVFSAPLISATIIFNDGTRLTEIEIVSINDGKITVEKDKKRRTFPLKLLKSYFQSDIQGAESGSMPGEFGDYSVAFTKINFPDHGVDSKGNTASAELNFFLKGLDSLARRVKVPYVYVYVLCSRSDDTKARPIYRYYFPDTAKPKAKNYDQAAVLEKLFAFDRPIWSTDDHSIHSGIRGRKWKFPLKEVKDRKILAYYIEVWGNDSIVYKKERKSFGVTKLPERWWESY